MKFVGVVSSWGKVLSFVAAPSGKQDSFNLQQLGKFAACLNELNKTPLDDDDDGDDMNGLVIQARFEDDLILYVVEEEKEGGGGVKLLSCFLCEKESGLNLLDISFLASFVLKEFRKCVEEQNYTCQLIAMKRRAQDDSTHYNFSDAMGNDNVDSSITDNWVIGFQDRILRRVLRKRPFQFLGGNLTWMLIDLQMGNQLLLCNWVRNATNNEFVQFFVESCKMCKLCSLKTFQKNDWDEILKIGMELGNDELYVYKDSLKLKKLMNRYAFIFVDNGMDIDFTLVESELNEL